MKKEIFNKKVEKFCINNNLRFSSELIGLQLEKYQYNKYYFYNMNNTIIKGFNSKNDVIEYIRQCDNKK